MEKKSNGLNTESEKIHIAVTLDPFAGFVQAVAGDDAEVSVVFPPNVSPHNFDPTPQTLMDVAECDLYFRTGDVFQLESVLMDKLSLMNEQLKTKDCSVGIDIIPHNTHYWLIPANAKIIVNNISEALIQNFPDREEIFETNTKKYLSELDKLDAEIIEKLSDLRTRTIIVYHPAWTYFAREYNLNEIAIEKHGKSPTPNDLKDLINLAKEQNIKAVFTEPQFESAHARTIADQIDAELVSINPLTENYIKNLSEAAEKIAKYGK
ncbi:MAG: zinc ABC transporter substrate-binding protein [Melioribacteraceae bacterium]|nr:zinc ABC transporter substrate-binding protein [Melioribacteraceae bacterium]MCF8353792.1 zinc ABC transporter substrate-binding protein [Melioribacteraceae bacterium]MCF8393628.1 zinc ABC transporter substrate-binding protein [Melioribacteraceae bacterium]MCF8419438.1 zinc ABC transporter substrate-binding protein [Melioribacteraceae bacterium]